jgi:hypothetical protein
LHSQADSEIAEKVSPVRHLRGKMSEQQQILGKQEKPESHERGKNDTAWKLLYRDCSLPVTTWRSNAAVSGMEATIPRSAIFPRGKQSLLSQSIRAIALQLPMVSSKSNSPIIYLTHSGEAPTTLEHLTPYS